MSTLLWLHQDLRLSDHPALSAAVAAGEPLLCVYLRDLTDPHRVEGAACWWLHHSLNALRDSLRERGGDLWLAEGSALRVLPELVERFACQRVFFSRSHEPWLAERQQRLHALLQARGVTCRRFAGSVLQEPESLLNGSGKPFQVFTPYYRKGCTLAPTRRPLPAPTAMSFVEADYHFAERLASWSLLPRQPDWASGFAEHWQPGEAAAQARLQQWQAQVERYGTRRDHPAQPGTSALSPHLHFGEISALSVHDTLAPLGEAAEPFVRQLYWRDFSYYLLHHYPHMLTEPFRPAFARFPWHEDRCALAAWQQGRTGYPLVDAGMRQLWQSGWMHNRVRMVAASFLTKHLLLHWQHGVDWFRDTLLDADVANNTAGWQWVAGCGADAAPYFRIFNPISQGQKFDPDGDYIRRFVPELAELPAKHIHAPWEAPPAVLRMAGVRLGMDYPLPIVEHAAARQRALDSYACIRQS